MNAEKSPKKACETAVNGLKFVNNQMRFREILQIVLLLTLTPLMRGQTLEVLHSFQGFQDGWQPLAELVEGNDGNFYGTTCEGGTNDYGSWGTIFKITTNGVLTTLSYFNKTNGANVKGPLIQDGDGNFYGTTTSGGDLLLNNGNGYGTVFKMTPDGALSTVVTFNGTNGSAPRSKLIQLDGFFYGTSETGGNLSLNNGAGFGTIFRLGSDGMLTTLISFKGSNGSSPNPLMALGADGNFYGTTLYGGPYGIYSNWGTLFRMAPNGHVTSLVYFNGTNGAFATAGLIGGSDGCFYGTTAEGGPTPHGSIFKITTNGLFSPVVYFNGYNGNGPHTRLLEASDANFYTILNGSLFRLRPDGTLNFLLFLESNGIDPYAGLIQGRDGNLYGVTSRGGTLDLGTIFRIVMPVTLDSRVSGNELVLSWPTNALGFTLQAAADLNSPTNWIDSTNAPAVVGSQFTVTNAITGSAQFYRLKKP